MLQHAGELARELFQDTLFDPPPCRVIERRMEAVIRSHAATVIRRTAFHSMIADSPAPGPNPCIHQTQREILSRDRRSSGIRDPIRSGSPRPAVARNPGGQDPESGSPVRERFADPDRLGFDHWGRVFRRLAGSFQRVFGSTIFFGTRADRGRSEVWDCNRVHFVDHVRLWFQNASDTEGRGRIW